MILQKLKQKAKEIKKNISVLILALKHPRTPWYAKALIGIIVSYALSPIDLIPDFIPIVGYLDDLVLLPAGITLAIKLIPKEIIEECKLMNEENQAMKSVGIYFAVFVVLFWLYIAYLIIKKIAPYILT